MSDLYKQKRELLKKKRSFRKKIMGRSEEESAAMRVYGEKTKTVRAIKVEIFKSKSKASGTDGESTSIENFIRECLISNNIKFIEQKAVRFINVDFYLPDYNLCIQAEGCYWHCCTKCYPAGPKNKQQRLALEKDVKSENIILEAKMKLLRIWHHEILENPELVKEKIKNIK